MEPKLMGLGLDWDGRGSSHWNDFLDFFRVVLDQDHVQPRRNRVFRLLGKGMEG